MNALLRLLRWALCLALLAGASQAGGIYPNAPSYISTPVLPNVAILLDNSVSMICRPGGWDPLDAGLCPTDALADLFNPGGAKINIAKNAIQQLVDQNWGRARWSLFSFNTWFFPAFSTRGAYLWADFNGSQAGFDNALKGILPMTITPTGDALYQIANYFAGTGGQSVFPTGYACAPNWLGLPVLYGNCAVYNFFQYAYQQYTSPVQYACQKNYAVLISDGQPDMQNTDEISVNGYSLNSYIQNRYGVALNTGALIPQMAEPVANIAAMYQDFGVAPAGASKDLDGNNYTPGNSVGYPAMTTYTVGFGGTDGTAGVNLMKATAYYGEPARQRAIDGPYQPGINAHNYYAAATQPDLTNALGAIFNNVASQAGSAVPGSFANPGGAGQMYQAGFDTANWSGQLSGAPFSNGSLDATQTVSASIPASGRTVLTTSGGGGAAFTASSLDNVSFNPSSSIAPATVANFVLGSDSAPTTRSRNGQLLGDIINSVPLAFTNQDAGQGLVAVGANDGMLHVFDGASLKELLGFVPATVQPALAALADPSYGQAVPHQYYVNGPLAEENAGGRNVLVGTLAQGGRGMFALDLSHTANFSSPASTVLWEKNSANLAALGYTFARPVIAKVNNGNNGSTWAAIVASGYDSNTTCSGSCSHGSQSTLYVLDLLRGTTLATLNVPGGNGLSSPAALNSKYGSGSDTGVVDRIYAGDLSGNLWVFDLSSTDPSQWKVLPKPLFQAHDSLGNAQPVTSRPTLTRTSQGSYMVIFGTGQLMYGGDETSTAQQAIYGVVDSMPANGSGWPLALSSLQRNVIADETAATVSGVDGVARSYTARNVTAASTTVSNPAGWYLPLQSPGLSNGGGERMLYEPLLLFGRLYFTTQIPRVNTSNHCLIGGAGWLMALDPLTGQRLARSPFDLDRSGQYNSSADLVTFPSSGTPQVVAGIQIGSGMPSALSFSAGSKKVAMQPYQTRDGQVVNALTPSSSLSSGGVLSYGTSANPPGGAADPNKGLMPINPDPTTARRLSWREIF